MGWQVYEIVFDIVSPICVGDKYIGSLRKCRPYVPASAMWGAITASLTRQLWERDELKDYDVKAKYRYVGKEILEKCLICGYFFILYENNILYPQYIAEHGLTYGKDNMSELEFESKFLTSMTVTGIDASTLGADEKTLHEVEFIRNRVMDENVPKPLKLIGAIYLDDKSLQWLEISESTSPLCRALKNISIGGGLRNGFGRLQLSNNGSIEKKENHTIFDLWKLKENLTLEPIETSVPPILSHLALDKNETINICGDVESLTGFSNYTDKSQFSTNLFTALPGAIINSQKTSTIRLRKSGLWNLTKN